MVLMVEFRSRDGAELSNIRCRFVAQLILNRWRLSDNAGRGMGMISGQTRKTQNSGGFVQLYQNLYLIVSPIAFLSRNLPNVYRGINNFNHICFIRYCLFRNYSPWYHTNLQLSKHSRHNAAHLDKRALVPDPRFQSLLAVFNSYTALLPAAYTHLSRALAPRVDPSDACL